MAANAPTPPTGLTTERDLARAAAEEIRDKARRQEFDWQRLNVELKKSARDLAARAEWKSNIRASLLHELLNGGDEQGYPHIQGETRWLKGWRSSQFPQTGDRLEMTTTLSKVTGRGVEVREAAVAIDYATKEWCQQIFIEGQNPYDFANNVRLARAASILYAAYCLAQNQERQSDEWKGGRSWEEERRIAAQEGFAAKVQQEMERIEKNRNSPAIDEALIRERTT
jgi:hypothetical protein